MTPRERDAIRAVVKALRGEGTAEMDAVAYAYGRISLDEALRTSLTGRKGRTRKINLRAADLLESVYAAAKMEK